MSRKVICFILLAVCVLSLFLLFHYTGNNKGGNGDIRNNKDLYKVLKGLGILAE